MATLSFGSPDLADPDFLRQRRRLVMESGELIGLEAVEPRRVESLEQDEERWDLYLYFLTADHRLLDEVTPDRLRIRLGNQHDPGIRVQSVAHAHEVGSPTLVVRVLRDSSSASREPNASPPVYTLELLDVPRVDRFFRQARFVFREGGALPRQSALRSTPGGAPKIPDIDYLAKDYQSFRRLILEQLNASVPNWRETHTADLGVTIVELLAHAADYLSYYQDAAMTEAYLATARQRISVRRHARLIDYRLHEGCNARCWVQLWVDRETAAGAGSGGEEGANARAEAGADDCQRGLDVPAGLDVLTYSGHLPSILIQDSIEHKTAEQRQPLVFRTLEARRLYPEHNEIEIYSWGAESFGLAAGTTSAALRGHLELQLGEVLIFQRGSGLEATDPQGTDLQRRQTVRLCLPPRHTLDNTPGVDQPVKITEIQWFAEDALVIDFPVSRRHGDRIWHNLTVVRGNLLLADHGRVYREKLEPVPEEGPYHPRLERRNVTHRAPYDGGRAYLEPAIEALRSDPRRALPAVTLYPLKPGEPVADRAPEAAQGADHWSGDAWHPRRDLLSSDRNARDFVVEIDDNGFACLRFGDNRNGRRPRPGTAFEAVYRVGQGPEGNVGAYSLRHLVIPESLHQKASRQGMSLIDVRNHLAGAGGLGPESVEAAVKRGPEALHSRSSRQSCVIDADFVEIAERHSEVFRAAVDHRWSGTTRVTQLFIQRAGGRSLDELLVARLHRFMKPRLVAGTELEILPPQHAPLHIRLRVWLEPTGIREHQTSKLLARVGAGEIELLRPDYFTFGQNVYLSEVIAETVALPEITDVKVEIFQRWGQPPKGELEAGEISIGPFEIAQLENDPAAFHRGILDIEVEELP